MMRLTPEDAGELLRARGLRSTPQRRAILSVFAGGRTEHLSADEIYARASRGLSELSRATVYATLAEFSELGLVSAFGSPEPVRYETNLEPHAHLRCQLCLRIFDLVGGQQDPGDITDPGFVAERVETRADGICDECTAYDRGLRAGASAMSRSGPCERHAFGVWRRRLGDRQSARNTDPGRDLPGFDPPGIRRSRRCSRVARLCLKTPRQPSRPSASGGGEHEPGEVFLR